LVDDGEAVWVGQGGMDPGSVLQSLKLH
jgi:hypothetical protein